VDPIAKVNKSELLECLQTFKARLKSDVMIAYEQRGSLFGRERFSAWKRQFAKFLDENLPGAATKLEEKLTHRIYSIRRDESDLSLFMRYDGEACIAFIDSLKLDIENDEFLAVLPQPQVDATNQETRPPNKRVFIVHGHDELLKTKTARFIEKLGYEAVILHEQMSKGMTIIEKIEANTDVGFAIVLYTPDDQGNANEKATKGALNLRARQNVVFEHGYLIAKLSRSRVVPLVSGAVELPSDISGVVFIDDVNWQIEIAKEMKGAGYDVDFNKIVEG
jgi:predicted nucleotide-binding protein